MFAFNLFFFEESYKMSNNKYSTFCPFPATGIEDAIRFSQTFNFKNIIFCLGEKKKKEIQLFNIHQSPLNCQKISSGAIIF